VTASAIGTSLPEFGSAMIAILTGSPDVGVGCALGANIWNIGGILGISALVTGSITTRKVDIQRDGLMAFLTALILFIFLFIFGNINIFAGILLISLYMAYLYYLINSQKKYKNESIKKTSAKNKNESVNFRKKVFLVILSIICLGIGCRILVYATVELSIFFSIPEIFAGILLAFGTTAPEFFTVMTSARRGLSSLAVGTVLGSNIFNIMIGLGVPALLVTIPVEKITIFYDAPALLIITLTLLLLLRIKYKISKMESLVLVLFYIIYISLRIFWPF
ncbi:MAG: calcium/sodium antiporter, partial [Methanobacteriaceae archaeon]|nr:calcium/sodium antiporter [Methanobacteriaceae archaeon]